MNIKLDIPEKFFEGEERSGYYVSPLMKKVWAVQLDLLAEFSRVCEKHNLKWWMEAGTLLGAVRHRGFIPWDDDSDVIMMRKDFDRLLEIAESEFKKPYFLRSWRSGENIPLARFINEDTTLLPYDSLITLRDEKKVSGYRCICLDVCPLDNLPDDERETKSLYTQMHSLARPRSVKIYDKIVRWTYYYRPSLSLWKRPITAALHYALSLVKPFIGGIKEKLRQKEEKQSKKFTDAFASLNYPDGRRIAKLVCANDSAFMSRRIWERSWFDETVYLPFEMLTLPAPLGYEKVLDTFYGNWHEYAIRYPHGAFYDPERPYTYYTQEGHMPE